MKFIRISGLIILLISFCGMLNAENYEVDVCVYGGTSAGVIAAYTVSSLGKTVLLIEPGCHLGGLSSGGLGATDIGNKFAITGMSLDFYRRLGAHYGEIEQWTFEPHVAEKIFSDYVKEADIHVLYRRRLHKLIKEDVRIRKIVLEHSESPERAPRITVKAKAFIDCTYEGDLMAMADVAYTVGREDNSLYGETLNGVQLRDKHQFPDGISPYKIADNPSSGLLDCVNPEPIMPTGTGDKKVQAYNFRLCLTRGDSANFIPIQKPDDYDSTRYELLLRIAEKQPELDWWQVARIVPMPNHKSDWNNRGGFSSDYIGMNYDYPEASYKHRQEIFEDHLSFTKGLHWFWRHDLRVPQRIRDRMNQWGLCKDEFQDTDGWPHQLYVREARRMIGSYVMTEHNCMGREVVDDGIGLGAYNMDSHNCQRVVVNGMLKNEGDVQVPVPEPYPIAYRSLTPKIEACQNLLVPVCLSASHIAYGSIRMEPVFMVLGQSAATAAVMAIDKDLPVQKINVSDLQKQLKENPYLDNRTQEILLDDLLSEEVTMSNGWVQTDTSSWRFMKYGNTFLTDDNSGKGNKWVRFTPEIKKTGRYEVFVYWPSVGKRASRVPVHLFHASGESVFHLDMSQRGNRWHSIGTFLFEEEKFQYLEIRTDQTDGLVLADAVMFFPKFK